MILLSSEDPKPTAKLDVAVARRDHRGAHGDDPEVGRSADHRGQGRCGNLPRTDTAAG